MRIKMISLMAGPAGTRQPGSVYTVDEAEGRMLIAAHAAVDVTAPVKAAAAPAKTTGNVPAGDPATRAKWIADVAKLAAIAGVDHGVALKEATAMAETIDADPDRTAAEPVEAAREIVDKVKPPPPIDNATGKTGNERATGRGQNKRNGRPR